jgi:hypothetical protein
MHIRIAWAVRKTIEDGWHNNLKEAEMALKEVLPAPPRGTRWSLTRRGDDVALTLRFRRPRRRVLATWSTEAFSELAPDPVTALRDVATQMAGRVDRRLVVAA